MPPRICPPLEAPVIVPAELAFVVPLAVDRARAETAARAAILESFLRPHDIKGARLATTLLAFVPFWRVEVAASGFHVGISSISVGKQGGTQIPVPTGGAAHQSGVVLVTARRLFPYAPETGGLSSDRSIRLFSSFAIRPEEMIARSSYAFPDAEIVDPDVTRDQAEREAVHEILRAVEPQRAIYSSYEPKVKGAALCHYPLYVTPYEYEGHANAAGSQSFYVIVSGRTGEVVGKKHPSALKALARKFRRLFAS
jgi:hypothetical protein